VGKKNIFPAIEIIVCGGREIFYEGINCDKEVMMLKLRRAFIGKILVSL
jgi:hypothetical protein